MIMLTKSYMPKGAKKATKYFPVENLNRKKVG